MATSVGRATEADVNVSLGLMNMIVNLYTGESREEKTKAAFKNCCPSCYTGKKEAVLLNVRYHCENGHGPFESGDVVKGSYDDDKILSIVGTSNEVKEQRTEAAELEKKHIDLEFLSAEEVAENFYPGPSCWVIQPKKAQPMFSLLMELMNDAGQFDIDGTLLVGVGQIRMRDIEHVVMLARWGDQMVFQKLFRPDDSKVFPAPIVSDVSDKNVNMAKTLISAMVLEFDPETYMDKSRERIVAWKQARSTGVTVDVGPKKASKDPNADLEAMLEAAVQAAKAKAS